MVESLEIFFCTFYCLPGINFMSDLMIDLKRNSYGTCRETEYFPVGLFMS